MKTKEKSLKFWKHVWNITNFNAESLEVKKDEAIVKVVCKGCGQPSYYHHGFGEPIKTFQCWNILCAHERNIKIIEPCAPVNYVKLP